MGNRGIELARGYSGADLAADPSYQEWLKSDPGYSDNSKFRQELLNYASREPAAARTPAVAPASTPSAAPAPSAGVGYTMSSGAASQEYSEHQQAVDRYNASVEARDRYDVVDGGLGRGGPTAVDEKVFRDANERADFINEGTRGGPTAVDEKVFRDANERADFINEGIRGGPTAVDEKVFQEAWDKYNLIEGGLSRGDRIDVSNAGASVGYTGRPRVERAAFATADDLAEAQSSGLVVPQEPGYETRPSGLAVPAAQPVPVPDGQTAPTAQPRLIIPARSRARWPSPPRPALSCSRHGSSSPGTSPA